ncbi:BQ5605_C027g10307 [Microbotryum silenes-dioicae]|uniref:BQ5605_C027g10307 protein n=1 Tax=Microbotryum silenes-dioicae TaxID=796604 RepID=A0A2X0MQU8_9BASI|nr:BQ5605_C027g10307 [Microbotryum silenes-dioicae]
MVGTFEGISLLVLRQTTSRTQYSILAGSHFLVSQVSFIIVLQSPASAFQVSCLIVLPSPASAFQSRLSVLVPLSLGSARPSRLSPWVS